MPTIESLEGLVGELERLGVPVDRRVDVGGWLAVELEQAEVCIEPRPSYCDRGRFIVKVFPRSGSDLELSLDSQDAFPRYYFGVVACASEVKAWIEVRGLL